MTEKASLVVIVGPCLFIGSVLGSNEAEERGTTMHFCNELPVTLTHFFSGVLVEKDRWFDGFFRLFMVTL